MAPITPSPSPAEAPQKLVDLHDPVKQTRFIDELAKSHKLTDSEKKEFTEKYKKAIDDLAKKHEAKKDIVIAEISDILRTFKESLQHEKKDDDDFTEFSSNTPDKDKTDTDTKEVLGSQEIDEHIKQLSDKIEAKLNTPATTPPENPVDKSPAAVVSRDLPALNIDANLPDIPEFKNPKQKGGIVEFIINWLGTTGIGGWLRKFIMGYDTMEEMTDTMAAMKNIMSIKKESPISAIINLTHITEYDFRDILRKNPRLDFSNMRNVEAAFLGKHAEDKKLAKYHCIYKGIEDMADKIGKTDSPGYDPMGRFSELLSYSKKPEFAPDYTEERVDTPVTVDTPQEKTEAEKLEERIQEVKTAGEADENLKKAQEEFEKAKALPDSADKGTKVTEAETKVKEAELAVKNIVEASKTKVGEMLKQSEDELKDTILTLEQKEKAKQTLKNQLDKDKTNKDLQSQLDTLEGEIKDLTIKKDALLVAIGKIKIESEKFPKDDTTKISAVESTKAAQETERLAGESIGVVEVQKTKEENDTEEGEFAKRLQEIENEANDILHDENKNYSGIDNPEDVKNLQEKIKSFLVGKNPEILKKYNGKILILQEKINFSQAKIELIQLWKKKEKEWGDKGNKINYGAIAGFGDGLIELDGTDIDVDIAWDLDDNVLMKTTDELITKLGGKASTVLTIIRNNESKLKGEEGFKSNKGKVFPINIDK